MTPSDELKEFLSYLASEKGVSPNTLSAYERDLKDFLIFARVRKFDWISADLRQLRGYLSALRKQGLSERSIARRASSLRQMYQFLLREGKLEGNPSELLTVIRRGRKLPKHLTEEEMVRLIQAADGSTEVSVRDRALLEFWYATGCRVSELAMLPISGVDFDEAQVKVTGKGARERLVPITEAAVEWGRRYQSLRHEWVRRSNLKEPDIFFLNQRARGFTRQGIWRLVKQYGEKAGLGRQVWPHMIRHSVATHVLHGGADLRAVQELLGHRSIATTEIYTHLDCENLKTMQQKYHPRG